MEWVSADELMIQHHSKTLNITCVFLIRLKPITLILIATAGEGKKMADATTMLSICDPVQLVLIRTDTSGETTLVSSYFLDWRTVLSSPSGKTCFAVELMGVGKDVICTTINMFVYFL